MRVDSLVLVRAATVHDIDAVIEVNRRAWQVAYRDLFEAAFLAARIDRRTSSWLELQRSPEHLRRRLLVAERGARIDAFAYLVPADHDGEAEIRSFYARPNTWGSGIAHTLLAGVWDALADRADRVSFWALSGVNRATKFFDTTGFVQTGRTRETDFGDGRPVAELEYARDVPTEQP